MATATLPIQPKPRRRARTDKPSDTGALYLCFNGELLRTLAEMAQLANSKLVPFVGELIEAQVATFRAAKIPGNFLEKYDGTPVPEIAEDVKPHLSRLSPEDKARIIEQNRNGMTTAQLATRWNVGASTILRVLRGAKKERVKKCDDLPPELVQRIIFLGGKSYEKNQREHREHIGVRQIAQRCATDVDTVRKVLSRHEPLVPYSTCSREARPGGWDKNVIARA
jgi:hypothetical protein